MIQRLLAFVPSPYVMAVALAAGGALFTFGYLKGTASAEERHLVEKVALRDELMKDAEKKTRIAVKAVEERHAAHTRITEVKPPSVSCDLAPECLQWHDRILKAGHTPGA